MLVLTKDLNVPTFTYGCLMTKQQAVADAPTFCLFHAPVGEILKWADIKRLEEEAGAPQRRTSLAKVKAIKRFLDTDHRNTIPTSVIVTIDGPPDRVRPVEGNGEHSFCVPRHRSSFQTHQSPDSLSTVNIDSLA